MLMCYRENSLSFQGCFYSSGSKEVSQQVSVPVSVHCVVALLIQIFLKTLEGKLILPVTHQHPVIKFTDPDVDKIINNINTALRTSVVNSQRKT